MDYLDLYPIQKVRSEDLFKACEAESLLIKAISKELNSYGLNLALPRLLIPGRPNNFEVHRHSISITFKTLGELDENIGYLIRRYGCTQDAFRYIEDKFIMPYSQILEASDEDFAMRLDVFNKNIEEVSRLSKVEKLEIVNIQGTGKEFKALVMSAESIYRPEDDDQLNKIWSYATYHRLNDWIQNHESAQSVKELVFEFTHPF